MLLPFWKKNFSLLHFSSLLNHSLLKYKMEWVNHVNRREKNCYEFFSPYHLLFYSFHYFQFTQWSVTVIELISREETTVSYILCTSCRITVMLNSFHFRSGWKGEWRKTWFFSFFKNGDDSLVTKTSLPDSIINLGESLILLCDTWKKIVSL